MLRLPSGLGWVPSEEGVSRLSRHLLGGLFFLLQAWRTCKAWFLLQFVKHFGQLHKGSNKGRCEKYT